ncbi:MAG: methyl-accepting chemotaxis protein [Acidobacteriota bacterium]
MKHAAGLSTPVLDLAHRLRLDSIRVQILLLLVAFALAPMVLSGLLAGYQGRRLLRQSIGSHLKLVAETVDRALESRIDQSRRSVRIMGSLPSIRGALRTRDLRAAPAAHEVEEKEAWFRGTRWEDMPQARHPLAKILTKVKDISGDLAQILVTDARGWLVTATERTEDLYQADEHWWQSTFALPCSQDLLSGLHLDRSVGDHVTSISVPVCEGGKRLGVLKAKLALGQFLDLVSKLDLVGGSSIWIIDRMGAAFALAGQGPLRDLNPRDLQLAALLVERDQHQRTGFYETAVGGVPAAVAYVSMRGKEDGVRLGWTILALRPAAEAYSPILRFQKLIAAGGLIMLLLAMVFGIRIAARVAHHLDNYIHVASSVADGDLTQELARSGSVELDGLAHGLNGMTGNLRSMVGAIRQATQQVESVASTAAEASSHVLEGSRQQIGRVQESTELMAEADRSMQHLSRHLAAMVTATDRSSHSIIEMDASIAEIVQSTEALARSTGTALTGVDEMVESIRQIDVSLESLRSLAQGSISKVQGMESGIRDIERDAELTVAATQRATSLAENGKAAVEHSIKGMVVIEETARRTSEVIERLTKEAGKISGIVEIIGDVTEQTNLLALNASILAAGAGEHGRGFAVVAGEIKNLAERTARSTNEIGRLVASIQNGTRDASQAMKDGLRHVEEGVLRSREVDKALNKILHGTGESSRMARQIVGAASEHMEQSRQMCLSMERCYETIASIAETTQQQSEGCNAMLQATREVRRLTSIVQRAISEQHRESNRIRGSVEEIRQMGRSMRSVEDQQNRIFHQVVDSMAQIGKLCEQHLAALSSMHGAIGTLGEWAVELRLRVSRFRHAETELNGVPRLVLPGAGAQGQPFT